MKLTAPISAAEYFYKTEHAVKHAYAGLGSCWQHLQETRNGRPAPVEKDGMLWYLPAETPEEKARLERSQAQYEKYFELQFSEALFAGSILEAAYMAIKCYSPSTLIPANCAAFVKSSKSKAVPFCIGPERHGVPTGLIVYAGRNQYAHWDEDELRDVNTAVFNALDSAFADSPFADLAFDFGNPLTISILAADVLVMALGWTSYEIYLAEMKKLVG